MKKVLVIDDDKQIRDLVVSYLEEEYHVFTVSGLLEFIHAFKREKPDIVITDYLLMNGEKGTDVRNWVESEDHEMPIIIMSGTMNHLPERERFGFCNYLKKPFGRTVLIDAIKKALS